MQTATLNHPPRRARFQGTPPAPTNAAALTIPEFAAEMRVAVSTVYRWIKQGRIVPVRIGGTTRIPRKVLDDTLAGRLA